MKRSVDKVCFVIATLGAGGAERVISLLAGEWIRRGKNVTIITLGPTGKDHYELPAAVNRIGLDVLKPSAGIVDAVRTNLRRLHKLRAAIVAERADVVISFMDAPNVLTLLATRGIGIPVVVSERIDPRHYPIAPGWQWLRKKLYPRAGAVVVQTESVAAWARDFVPADKVNVIPNPVQALMATDSPKPERVTIADEDMLIAAMGRLDRQKGFDLLLQAFAALPADIRSRLLILGEGPEREALMLEAAQLGISDRVTMPGRMANPFPVLLQADVFVLSSRFEGFPNALLEAMALGLPVVSFDCPSGPSDIVVDGENGLLVEPESTIELSKAIERLLRDQELRHRIGKTAREMADRYCLENIVNKWERVIEDCHLLKERQV